MTYKVLELLKAAFDRPDLQNKLHSADTPEQFVRIAMENGYQLTQEELALSLGKVHQVFGQVVESMISQLTAQGSGSNGKTPTEKIAGTNVDLVKRLFSRGEAFDSEGFITFFTDTPVYQFGNFDVCLDKAAIKKSADNFFSQIDAVYHEIKMIWEEGDVVFVEMDVLYWRKDGSMVSLPCSDIFRVEGDKFSELRIFMDVNPVFNPSLPVPKSASVLTVSQGQTMIPPGTMRRHFAEHPEGRERVKQGFIPKWAIAGPKWSIEEEKTTTPEQSQQLAAVGEISQAVVAQDWEKVKRYLTDDILYKVGSGEARYGPQAVVDFFKDTFKNIGIFAGHKVRKVWQEADIIAIEMDAYYEMVGTKKRVTISCCDIYRMRGNKVSEWRVYADMSPWGEA
jgi:predicted SnoaL-like aldol condensation-catalyzing enzyme